MSGRELDQLRGDAPLVMRLPPRQRFTFDEYLLLEDDAEVKHEFLDGEVWAMAGGPPEHAAIIGNVTTLLNVQLRGQRCRVHSTELRVRVKATGLATYPDVTVICGRLERDPDDRSGHTAINPRAIVEVLSLSTEGYDRGEKLPVLAAAPGAAPRACGPVRSRTARGTHRAAREGRGSPRAVDHGSSGHR